MAHEPDMLCVPRAERSMIAALEAAVGRPGTLLDVGCGDNSPILRFSRRPAFSVGVDLCRPWIEESRRRGVLDPFCGCGTTVAVASRMGRKWLGIDISPTAMRVIRRRLNRDKVYDFRIDGMPENEADLRKLQHYEFQNWLIDRINARHSPRKSGDMGIDGFSFFDMYPIQVKQVERVGRDTVDEFETAVLRDGEKKASSW